MSKKGHKKHHKKHKTIMQRVKAEARSIHTEAFVQATQAHSMGELWRNYIKTIQDSVAEFKRRRKAKKARVK